MNVTHIAGPDHYERCPAFPELEGLLKIADQRTVEEVFPKDVEGKHRSAAAPFNFSGWLKRTRME